MAVNASAINTPLEALFDRTAALSPAESVYTTAGSFTYTIPALTRWLDIIVVGGGGAGGGCPDSSYHGGGGGGGSGEIVIRRVAVGPNDAPLQVGDELSVRVGVEGSPGVGAGYSYVQREANGFSVFAAAGAPGEPCAAETGGKGGAGGRSFSADYGAGSGAGGDGADSGAGARGSHGAAGYCCLYSAGGEGGTYGVSGSPGQGGRAGLGFGAGGGGCGGSGYNYSSGPGGGGAGAGGYGTETLAAAGSTGPTTDSIRLGARGAVGLVRIVAWRGAPR